MLLTEYHKSCINKSWSRELANFYFMFIDATVFNGKAYSNLHRLALFACSLIMTGLNCSRVEEAIIKDEIYQLFFGSFIIFENPAFVFVRLKEKVKGITSGDVSGSLSITFKLVKSSKQVESHSKAVMNHFNFLFNKVKKRPD